MAIKEPGENVSPICRCVIFWQCHSKLGAFIWDSTPFLRKSKCLIAFPSNFLPLLQFSRRFFPSASFYPNFLPRGSSFSLEGDPLYLVYSPLSVPFFNTLTIPDCHLIFHINVNDHKVIFIFYPFTKSLVNFYYFIILPFLNHRTYIFCTSHSFFHYY